MLLNLAIVAIIAISFILLFLFNRHQSTTLHHLMSEKLADNHHKSLQQLHEFKLQLLHNLNEQRHTVDKHQLETLKILQDSLQKGMSESRTQVIESLTANTKSLTERVESLTKTTEARLKDISGQVEKRLSDGFEKTTQTFADILKRLALIDQAQQKITELSTNVVNLQHLLADKRSRGAFGEVQLSALIRNVLPEEHFALQFTFKNGKKCDCVLFLPEPSGNIVIDAKFPLENYQRSMEHALVASEVDKYRKQFRQDIRVHIKDIQEKYIIPGETADGAIMFIPAEAIFAEIHAHFPDLVELSHQAKVWLVSPTTMMAILTTARAVLKDDATKKQVHIIQEHLQQLAKDFSRFQNRMDNLQKHIEQAGDDVRDANISARKITSRFVKIDKVELEGEAVKMLKTNIEVKIPLP